MPKSGKVDWYANDVLLVVEDATDEILTKLAFYVEGEAKVNMNVDTGFMRNSTYTIPAGNPSEYPGWQSGQYKNKAGQMVQRNQVGITPEVPAHDAAVHVAAEYAIFQEMKKASLYPALEKARKIAPGVIKEVGKARL